MSPGRQELLEELRPAAFSVAYRMLGSVAEAEDVVQESLLRVDHALTGGERIGSPRAYIVTIATRLAIVELRSARVRRALRGGVDGWSTVPWRPAPPRAGRGSRVASEHVRGSPRRHSGMVEDLPWARVLARPFVGQASTGFGLLGVASRCATVAMDRYPLSHATSVGKRSSGPSPVWLLIPSRPGPRRAVRPISVLHVTLPPWLVGHRGRVLSTADAGRAVGSGGCRRRRSETSDAALVLG